MPPRDYSPLVHFRKRIADHGIALMDVAILAVLAQRGPATYTGICTAADGINAFTVRRNVAELAKKGLLAVSRNKEAQAEITPAGRALLDSLMDSFDPQGSADHAGPPA